MTTDSTHEARIVPTPLEMLASVSAEIYSRWDKDQRSGKLLSALAGSLPGYDPRTDAIRATLAAPRIVPGEASEEMIEAAANVEFPDGVLLGREYAEIVLRAALAASSSATPADLEAESRELLAAIYEAGGDKAAAYSVRTIGSFGTVLTAQLDIIARALSARQIAQGVGEQLFSAIQHGDDDHRAWLKEAISAFFAGQPVPPPRGGGRKEARIAELEAMLAPPPSVEADAMVEQLRHYSTQPVPCYSVGHLLKRAAALITRLSGGEVERLREPKCTCGEIDGENPNCPLHGGDDPILSPLRSIAYCDIGEYETSDAHLRAVFFACRAKARAALTPKESQP